MLVADTAALLEAPTSLVGPVELSTSELLIADAMAGSEDESEEKIDDGSEVGDEEESEAADTDTDSEAEADDLNDQHCSFTCRTLPPSRSPGHHQTHSSGSTEDGDGEADDMEETLVNSVLVDEDSSL